MKQSKNLKAGSLRSQVSRFLRSLGFGGLSSHYKYEEFEASIRDGALTVYVDMFLYPSSNKMMLKEQAAKRSQFRKKAFVLKKIKSEFGGKLLATEKIVHRGYSGGISSVEYKRSLVIKIK